MEKDKQAENHRVLVAGRIKLPNKEKAQSKVCVLHVANLNLTFSTAYPQAPIRIILEHKTMINPLALPGMNSPKQSPLGHPLGNNKLASLLKTIYRFNANPTIISMKFLKKRKEIILKFLWNQEKNSGIMLPDFKSFSKTIWILKYDKE